MNDGRLKMSAAPSLPSHFRGHPPHIQTGHFEAGLTSPWKKIQTMMTYIHSNAFIKSLEFWTASSIFLVAVGFRLLAYVSGDTADVPVPDISRIGRMPEHYYRMHFLLWLARNLVLYLAFLAICFRVLPSILRSRLAIFEALLLLVLSGFCLGAIRYSVLLQCPDGMTRQVDIFRAEMIEACRLAGLFLIYYLARNAAMSFLRRDGLSGFGKLAVVACIVGLFFSLALSEAPITMLIPVTLSLLIWAIAWSASRRMRPGSLRPVSQETIWR